MRFPIIPIDATASTALPLNGSMTVLLSLEDPAAFIEALQAAGGR